VTVENKAWQGRLSPAAETNVKGKLPSSNCKLESRSKPLDDDAAISSALGGGRLQNSTSTLSFPARFRLPLSSLIGRRMMPHDDY
jgi:hypothetical protein